MNLIGYVLPKSATVSGWRFLWECPVMQHFFHQVIQDISLAAGKSRKKIALWLVIRCDLSGNSLPFRPSSPYYCDIDYNYSLIEVAPIAQLDRALVFGTSGWEFESLWAHFQFNLATHVFFWNRNILVISIMTPLERSGMCPWIRIMVILVSSIPRML